MATPQGTSRRYDLDWLRVLGVCVVFFYHLARVFDPFWWHIKNARLYPFAGLARLLVGAWMMPLLFLVSGAAVFYALRTRDARAFVTDRAARLLVPFGVGVFTHIALQVYLERLSFGQFAGSFPAFYPHYFDGIYGFGGNFAWMGLHLWFLPALFFYSALFLPLFLRWKGPADAVMQSGSTARPSIQGDPSPNRGACGSEASRSHQSASSRLAAFLARPGAVYLLALPVMALLVALDPATLPGSRDAGGWSLLIYPIFFLYGFILVSHPALEESIRPLRRVSLAAALLLSVGVTLAWLRNGEPGYSEPGFAFFAALYGLNAWCWLLVIWGFGTRRLNFTTPLLRYANDAILPFYALHQTVMVAVAFFVVRWPIPDALKFIVIAAFSLAIILALYQFLIRPFNPMRVLFGLRPRNH